MRYLLALLIIILATPALASTPCPPGQGRQHGICTPMPSKAAQLPASSAAPVVVDPYELHPPLAPRDVTPTATDAHKLKDAVIPAGLSYHDEIGKTRGYIVATGGPVNNLLVERVKIDCRATCLFLKRPGGPTTIRDVELFSSIVDTSNGYQAGLKLDNGQHDVLIERAYVHDWIGTVPANYPNRDCFGDEREDYNITFRYTRAARCTDGAYDLKSTGTLLDHTKADGPGRYAYRLWGGGKGTDVYASGQFHAGIQMKTTTDYTIAFWHNASLMADADVVSDGVPTAGQLPVVHVAACDRPIVVHVAKGFTVDAGPTCRAK